jgi:hypothetical protein
LLSLPALRSESGASSRGNALDNTGGRFCPSAAATASVMSVQFDPVRQLFVVRWFERGSQRTRRFVDEADAIAFERGRSDSAASRGRGGQREPSTVMRGKAHAVRRGPGTRIGPDIFQSSPVMRLRCTRTAMCRSDTRIEWCSLDCPAEPPPFDPATRRTDVTLARQRVCHKGVDYATTADELRTSVWSVGPRGLDSPPGGLLLTGGRNRGLQIACN